MELLQLRYFCALAEKQHLRKTAEELMISPPSLSLTITRLEKELDLDLFDRTGRNMVLNEDGKAFYRKVRHALSLLDEAVEDMEYAKIRKESSILVGTTSILYWDDMVNAFSKEHPNIHVILQQIPTEELNDPENRFEFTLGNDLSIDQERRETLRLSKEERPVLLLSKNNLLARNSSVHLTDIRDQTFIVLNTSPQSKEYLYTLCEAEGFTPQNVKETTLFLRIIQLQRNEGVALSTNLAYKKQFLNPGNVKVLRVETSYPTRHQCISWRKDLRLTENDMKFLRFVMNYENFT